MTFYLKWRDDADGFVKHFAGNVMRHPFDTREEAEELRRAMLNGGHVEVVEVKQ